VQQALEKKERLSPSPCMHTASIWGEGTFCLDREFSKNAPYKQRIIFHLESSAEMSQKIFFAWTVGQWYPQIEPPDFLLMFLTQITQCSLKKITI